MKFAAPIYRFKRKPIIARLAYWASLLVLIAWGSPTLISAQLLVEWDLTYGGGNYEELNGLAVLPDGVVIGGSSRSNADFGHPADTSWNILLVKTNLDGLPLWRNMVGGDRNDRLWDLIVTRDGGLLAGGYSYSGPSGQKNSANKGDMDVWLLRFNADGQLLWERSYGGTGRDELFSIIELANGDLLLGAHSNSDQGGDKSENSRGGLDFWLICTDADGHKRWDKTLGGNGVDQLHDIALLPDGNILASGGTASMRNTGEVGPDFARGGMDYWVVKFDPITRQSIWDHRFGGTAVEFAYALLPSRKGTIYLGGLSASIEAPPTSNNNGKNTPFFGGPSDYWLLELDENGQKINEWGFGGNGLDDLFYLHENDARQLVLGGVSDSDVSGNKTSGLRQRYDYWLIGLDPQGQESWQANLGGTDHDALTRIQRKQNGALLLGGHSQSPAGYEKTQNGAGANDFWILNTLCETDVQINWPNNQPPCADAPIDLNAVATACSECIYLWNTEADSSTITILPGTSDTFVVRVFDIYGCTASDTVFVDLPSPFEIELSTFDTVLIAESEATIGVTGQSDWQYQWNTGAQTPSITVGESGWYSLTVTNSAGCTASDAVFVAFEKKSAVWAPNIFSADANGYNDYFIIYCDQSVKQVVQLTVADRWGELVWQKKRFFPQFDPQGWDGTFRGKKADEGVYTWVAEIEFLDGTKNTFFGSVALIRQ